MLFHPLLQNNLQFLKTLENINALRKSITEPIEKLRESLKDVSGRQYAEKIYRYLRDNKADERLKDYALLLESQGLGELAIEQEQVWDILMEILDELALSLGDRNVSVKRFLELFEIVVASKSLGKLPDGYDEVSICSADRMLTNSAKAVFVVGMNIGVFPLQRSQGGIFTGDTDLAHGVIRCPFQIQRERICADDGSSAGQG